MDMTSGKTNTVKLRVKEIPLQELKQILLYMVQMKRNTKLKLYLMMKRVFRKVMQLH